MSLKYDEVLDKLANEVVEDISLEKQASEEDELLKQASEAGMEIIEKIAEYNETSSEDVEDFLDKLAEELEDVDMLKQAITEVYDEYSEVDSTLGDVISTIEAREEHVASLLDDAGIEKIAGVKADKVMEMLRALQSRAKALKGKAMPPKSNMQKLKNMMGKKKPSMMERAKNPAIAALAGGVAGAGAGALASKRAEFDSEFIEKVAEYNETTEEDVNEFMFKLAEELEDVDILKQAAMEVAEEYENIKEALETACDTVEAREEHVANLLDDAGFEKVAGLKGKSIMDTLRRFKKNKGAKYLGEKGKGGQFVPSGAAKANLKGSKLKGMTKGPSDQLMLPAAKKSDIAKGKLMSAIKSPYARYGAAGLAGAGAGYSAEKMREKAAEMIIENQLAKEAADENTLEILAQLEEAGIDPNEFIENM